MATLYLYEKDGSGPVVCSGSVNSGTCTYFDEGKFIVVDGNETRLYQLNGSTVTDLGQISAQNYLGIAFTRDFQGGGGLSQRLKGDKIFEMRLLSEQVG